MADDITLTVRVRDLSQGELGRLNRQMNDLRRNFRNAGNTANQTNQGFRRLGDDINRVNTQLRQMLQSGRLSTRQLAQMNDDLDLVSNGLRRARREGQISSARFRSMSRDVDLLRARLVLVGRQGNVFTRMSAHALLLQQRLRDSNTHTNAFRRSLVRLGDSGAGGLRHVTRGLGEVFHQMGRLTSRFSNLSGRWKAILISSLVLIGPIAQALGALLVTALGGAFIALGAFALRGSEDVRSAFQDMKSTIGTTVREAAAPLEGPLVSAMQSVGAASAAMRPQLTEAFEATAPLVHDFVGAFTALAQSALPGLTTALKQSGPAMQGFRAAMADIGAGIGEMFAAITGGGGGQALERVWRDLGNGIRDVLQSLGDFIRTASESEGTAALLRGILFSLARAFDALSISIQVGEFWFQLLNTGVQKTRGFLNDLLGVSDGVKRKWSEAGSTSGQFAKRMFDATKEVRDQVLAVDELINKLRELNEANRTDLDARAKLTQAILDGKEGQKEFAEALSMTKGQLDLNNQASVDAYKLLSDIASATNDATKSAEEADKPWQAIRAEWSRGREEFIKLADGMGLTREEAILLADQLIKMPDAHIDVRARTDQAVEDLDSVIKAYQDAPDEKTITVKTLSAEAIEILEALGFKITQLPDGSFKVIAETQGAKNDIADVQRARDNLKSKGISISANTGAFWSSANSLIGRVLGTSYINVETRRVESSLQPRFSAAGNMFRSFAKGGMEKHVAQIASGGPIRVWAEKETGGESYIPLGPSKRPRSRRIAEQTVGILGGRVEWFAKGGLTDSQKRARSELSGKIGMSYFGQVAGYKLDPFQKALSRPDSVSDLVRSLNEFRNLIKKAASGQQEKSLLTTLAVAGKALIKHQRKLDKVNESLEKAKDKLDGLRDAASNLQSSVKEGIIGEFNMTRAANAEDSQVTINTLLSQARGDSAQSAEFEKSLAALKKKGVSGRIIEQVAQAGVQGGGLETARALLGANSGQIKELNTLNQNIRQSAHDSGNIAADAMYGAGIKAAEGLVKGLRSQRDKIEREMLSLAKYVERAIKRGLGISSPSKVMEQVGNFTAEGFAIGIENNRRIPGSWESMLTMPRSAQPVPSGTRYTTQNNQPIVLNVHFGQREFGQIWVDVGRKEVSTRGGLRATLGRVD